VANYHSISETVKHRQFLQRMLLRSVVSKNNEMKILNIALNIVRRAEYLLDKRSN